MDLCNPLKPTVMVFIEDRGSQFKGSLDKVWKLNTSEGQHPHASMRNYAPTMSGENAMVVTWEHTVAGRNEKSKVKLILMPPVGYSMEYLEGPFAGSKTFQYYIPKGDKTGVDVVGEWKSPSLSPDSLKKEALKFLDTVFNEDQENLKNLK
jgi:ABC-type glycerol-3-phosphate transport system substrate-binding protein